MTSITRRPTLSGTQLLSRILDAPALVAAVRALPAPALASLVHHVGLEDAGELVSLASSEQLQELFDDDLWLGDPEQAEERFDPARFDPLLSLLQREGVVDSPGVTRALTRGSAPPQQTGLRWRLRAMAETHPERHAEMLEELSYLANVLLAASRAYGPLRPVEALECAVSVCDLGLQQTGGTSLPRDLLLEKVFLRGLREIRLRVDLREGFPYGALPDWLVGQDRDGER